MEDIYTIDEEGRNVRALTKDGHSHDAAWSPDGKRILFVHDSALTIKPAYREEKQYETHYSTELWLKDRNGGNDRLLRRMEPGIFGAAWSPEGETIGVSLLPAQSMKLVFAPVR